MTSRLIALLLIIVSKSVYAQCAMCKAVVEGGDKKMAEGVNNGITYLMIFPYVLIGLLIFFLIRYRRNIKK